MDQELFLFSSLFEADLKGSWEKKGGDHLPGNIKKINGKNSIIISPNHPPTHVSTETKTNVYRRNTITGNQCQYPLFQHVHQLPSQHFFRGKENGEWWEHNLIANTPSKSCHCLIYFYKKRFQFLIMSKMQLHLRCFNLAESLKQKQLHPWSPLCQKWGEESSCYQENCGYFGQAGLKGGNQPKMTSSSGSWKQRWKSVKKREG